MTAGTTVPLETRIAGALNIILSIYGIPEDVIKTKIDEVFAMDYRRIGKRAVASFNKYVEKANDKALRNLVNIK